MFDYVPEPGTTNNTQLQLCNLYACIVAKSLTSAQKLQGGFYYKFKSSFHRPSNMTKTVCNFYTMKT